MLVDHNSMLTVSGRDISIIVIAVVISLSGLIVNFVRKSSGQRTISQENGFTLLLFRAMIPFALGCALLVYFLRVGHYTSAGLFAGLGYALVAAGMLLRWMAILSLGNAFQVKVSIAADQRLKTDGVYTWIRHPSYTGLLLYYFGIGIVMQNWIALLMLTVVPLMTVLIRIKTEERFLRGHFGREYELYSRRTSRLMPVVY